jgi:transposase-like protein
MIKCPYCQRSETQVKDGLNGSGSQRYRCKACQRRYTPEPQQHGYNEDLRQSAVKMYVDGMNFRRIARHLKVNHQSVINWVNAHVAQVPTTPPVADKKPNIVELDELFTFIGDKKTGPTS